MNRRIRTATSIIVLSLSLNAFAADQPGSFRVACVGDSITYGSGINERDKNSYPSQLARMLGENWTVRNFGVSGATLLKKGNKPYWKQAAYQAALDFKPDVVVIKLGTNDSKPQNWQYKTDFVADYIELIESFQKLESRPAVWICYPVPAYPGRWGISDKVIKEEVMPLMDEVARRADVKMINLYTALSDKKEMFPDTVHPNAAGAKVMAGTIAEIISVQNARVPILE